MFENRQMQIEFKKLQNDVEINTQTEEFVSNVEVLQSPELLREKTRDLTILYMQKLRPIVVTVYNKLKHLFLNEKMDSFRPIYDADNTKMNQKPEMTFPWVQTNYLQMKKEIIKKIDDAHANRLKTKNKIRIKQLDNEIVKLTSYLHRLTQRYHNSKHIKTQEQYRVYVTKMSKLKYGSLTLPPLPVLYNIILAEEDGKTPLYMKFLHSMLTTIFNMVFNPPYFKTQPAIYFTSGSDTQFNSISAVASPLSYILCPAIKSDQKHTMVWRGQLFRRGLNDMNDVTALAHRVPCLCMENNVMLNVAYLKCFERNPMLLKDPEYHPESVRIFATHESINEYINKMASTGKPDVTINDLAIVSSYIVPVNGEIICTGGGYTNNGDSGGVNQMELSIKHPYEAAKCRVQYWKKKVRKIYCPYNKKFKKATDDNEDDDENNPTNPFVLERRKLFYGGGYANRVSPSCLKNMIKRTEEEKKQPKKRGDIYDQRSLMYDSQHDVYVGRQLEKLQDCYKQELAENYSDVAKLELEELSLQNHGYCEMNTKKNNSDKEKLITKSLQSCYPPKKKT